MSDDQPRAAHSFERLQAWAACHHLVLAVYSASAAWPKEERYGLTAQARSAAVSAAANICEGSSRRGPKEFKRFLDIALGSLAELAYYLRLARDLEILSREDSTELEIHRDHASRLTWGLAHAIGRAKAPPRLSDRPTV